MRKFVDNCYRAARDGAHASPDLATSALAVGLNHPEALEAFGLWAADQIVGDVFTMVFWAALALVAFWVWPRLPAPVRRALLEARGGCPTGALVAGEGMMPPMVENGSERRGQDQHEDATLSPSGAAAVLGIGKRQVLNYLNSGELVGTQDPETGRWSIPPAHVEDLRRRREHEQRKKPPKDSPQDQATHAADRELVETLREQVEDLRARLDTADQRDREQRRIIAALTSRIPELPSAPVQHDAPAEAAGEPESTSPTHAPRRDPEGPQAATSQQQRAESRPWWRRILGS